MKLSVVICSYNRAESLRRVLEAVDTQVTPADLAWEVLVVDNASTDHTRAVAEAFVARRPDRFRALHEPKKGKSNALNLAIAEARGEILAFTDDDVELPQNWVAEIAAAFERHDCVGIGGRILPIFKHGRPSWMDEVSKFWISGPLVHFELGDEPVRLNRSPFGANMAFRRGVFARHGGFRADLGPLGDQMKPGETRKRRIRVDGRGEDVELANRVLRAGETIMYVPTAVAHHPVEPERLHKEYFQQWWYRQGRAAVVEEDEALGPVTFFGVPRYLFRVAGESAMRWLFSVDEKKRLYAKLAMMDTFGRIVEMNNRWRAKRR